MKIFGAIMLGVLSASILQAQDTKPTRQAKSDSATRVSEVHVRAKRVRVLPDTLRTPAMQQLTLPVTASVTARRIEETVNLLDPEDAVKYLPSIFVRKRNYGDTQAVIETRTWGVSSSARSLVFADGVPLTALISNNNTNGAPRWGLVSPEEIVRIDMMYGPFSAAYAGNSLGAVMEITTRMPDKVEGSIAQTVALQTFNLYGTDRTFATSQTSLHFGDRFGKFSFWVGGTYQDSRSQPLTYATSATLPAGTTGAYPANNKLNAPANVLGATGLLSTGMTNAKAKVAYDITPSLRAAYTLGYWVNDASAGVQTYLTSTATATPTYAGNASFASGNYDLIQKHTSHSVSLRSDTHADWDYEVVGTLYRFGTDEQRFPLTASATGTPASFSTNGRLAVLNGTGWETFDAKGSWHPGGALAKNALSFGAHIDQYKLFNPTYNIPDWQNGSAASATSVATEGDGKTRTAALWVQDSWHISPTFTATLGGRLENWRAFDGFNANGATQVTQPTRSATRFSPKAILAWSPTDSWLVTGSLGKAYRFATPTELYQLVSTGVTFTSPDPNLKPDNDLSAELRVERRFSKGRAQVAVFQDDIHDAIISQFLPIVAGSPNFYSVVSNVDHVRSRGLEASLGRDDVLIRGLELSGSATYVDAETLALSGRASATAPAGTAVGRQLPNIPKWRATAVATYRPTAQLAFTGAVRYASKVYTTLDNSDVNFFTYQAFSRYIVVDARVNYRFADHWSASLGVDNIGNYTYWYFHPFPKRTFVGTLRYTF